MRVKKRVDYNAVSRQSVKRDFQRFTNYRREEVRPEIKPSEPEEEDTRRVAEICGNSSYAQYARYIVGKLVRIVEKSSIGNHSFYCEFVHDEDRKALNKAACWSDNKNRYLLDGVKFR